MSFLRTALSRRRQLSGRPARDFYAEWWHWRDEEEYALALMKGGVPTDRARELLRIAVRESEQLQAEQGSAAEQRERREEWNDRMAIAHEAAAERLLRETGRWGGEWPPN